MHKKYINEIEDKGFTIIENAVSAAEVKTLSAKVKDLDKNFPKPELTTVPRLNKLSRIVYNPEQKDVIFSKVLLKNNTLRNVLMHFLNDEWYRQLPSDKPNYILRAMVARSSSSAPLPMHIDSFIPSSGKRCFVMQAALLLNDQTKENGCTIVVPGSHKSDEFAPPETFETAEPICASKGDLVVWDSRLWHGALPNHGGGDRWSIIATFTRWWIKQNYQITKSLPSTIYKELTNEERSILGFCSTPPNDEFERIDIKAGYEIL